MSRDYNNPAFKKLVQKLQEESWQLELLISGFAIFGLFTAFPIISDSVRDAQNKQQIYKFVISLVAQISCGILIFNLLLHVMLRGLWIGALGLRYVSGDIDYESLNYHERFTKYLKKKVGYYKSEESYVEKLCHELCIEPHHRHPVSYIMEAADDISYCLADLEDAVEKGILDTQKLKVALCEEYKSQLEKLGLEVASKEMNKITDYAEKSAANEEVSKDSQFFFSLRVDYILPLVKHAVSRFIDNIESVYNGSFNGALLEDKSHEHALSAAFKMVALKYAFCDKEVENRELQGYKIITRII